MTRFLDRERARKLRAKGKSYSQIKSVLGVGKGTLSAWLEDMPLSTEQIRELRDLNPRRIENFRKTMQRKRESRLAVAYDRARNDIGRLSRREVFIAGFYLYWAEGTKTHKGNIGITNTDPAVIRVFLNWASIVKIPREKMYVRLHLYADMDAEKEICYWAQELNFSRAQFRSPHVKKSLLTGLTYKNGFGHGTCNLRFENMAMWEYITGALKYLHESHARP